MSGKMTPLARALLDRSYLRQIPDKGNRAQRRRSAHLKGKLARYAAKVGERKVRAALKRGSLADAAREAAATEAAQASGIPLNTWEAKGGGDAGSEG